MQTAIYLFCLARAGQLSDLTVTGPNGKSSVFQHDFANVTAVVSEVPLDEFCGPAAEARLQDVAWVGARALFHQQVIESAMQHSPVLPARFGALFSSTDSLEVLVKRNLHDINAFLDAVTDKDEWAVKVVLSRSELKERLFTEKLAEHSAMLASLSRGVRYFKERQLLAEVEKEIRSRVKEITNDAVSRLSDCSADQRRRDVIFRTDEETDIETVANWAFLVERRKFGGFRDVITAVNAECRSSGLSLDLAGPWPP